MSNESEKAIMSVARERYWEEAEPADQINRLRDEVARLCKLVQQQAQVMVKYGVHSHTADGKLVVGLADSLEQQPRDLFAHDGGIPHRIRTQRDRG